MLFNSIEFVFFFIAVSSLYFVLPQRMRWVLLLAASCYFYMAFVPVYILILGFTIVIDYYAGIFLEEAKGRKRKTFLIMSLVANIGVLAIFKYYNFINENLTWLIHGAGFRNPIPYLSIILPIGLSFHTFQAMSYTIEVYRGHQPAERNFGIYALYVMFYPQLVAGPIERPQNLLHQFREKHRFEYDRVVSGLKLMLWGFFKKLVVADRVAVYVNATYENPESHSGLTLAFATFFFAFQIYCDFSGYSDIAIGAARVMGFKLMKNFNRPYFATSISEFWKRWHISLSTWFKDYLYLSLGGNRVGIPRWYINLFIVFLVSGIWHGANWTYVIWGALNGLYLIFAIVRSRYLDPKLDKFFPVKSVWVQAVQVATTFILICLSWVFFRAESVDEAFLIINKISRLQGPLFIDSLSMGYGLMGIAVLMAREAKHEYFPHSTSWFNHQNPYIRYAACLLILTLISLIGVYDGGQFIYFQF